MGNYSFKTTGLPEPVNGVVEGHNFTQGVPHTAIYSGYTGLTFRNCNLCNCDVPGDSTIISCNTGQVSFCGNIHINWAEKGVIPSCAENCSHVTDYDTITIDDVSVDTNYAYTDEVQ